MKNKLIIVIIIIAIILLGYYIESDATIKTSSLEVESGEQFDIQVTSDISLASYTIQVESNSELTFVNSKGGSNGEGTKTISYATGTGGITNLATFTFKAPDVTNDTKYTITFSATGMGDENLASIPNSKSTSTITVKAPTQVEPEPTTTSTPEPTSEPTVSNNAYLSNLGIKPTQYDFHNFTQNRTNYTATVPYEITSVETWYTKSDSKATVKVTGGNNLEVGNNNITVVVTAEDGKTTTTYKIVVTRQAEVTNESQEDEEEPQDETSSQENKDGLKSLEISGIILSPEFSTDIYEYTAALEEDLTSLEINTEATSEDYKVVIAGNEDLIDGENLINIIVYDENDTVIAIYQITVNKSVLNTEEINEIFSNTKKTSIIKMVVIILIIILVIIGILIYAIIHIKIDKEDDDENSKTKKNKENEYNNFEDEEFKQETDKIFGINEDIEIEDVNKDKKGKHF